MAFEYPWWLVLPSLIIGAGVALGLYYRNPANNGIDQRLMPVLAALRGAAVALILILLIGPLLRSLLNEVEKPVVVLAHDNSSSIVMNRDSAWYRSEYLKNIEALRQKLGEKYEVQAFQFDGNVGQWQSAPDFKGQRTDLEALFTDLEGRYSGRNVGAVILATDGVVNRGALPEYRALRLKAPVFAVALGDTARQRDVLVRRLEHNRYAYLGNDFPIEADIEADLLRGTQIKIAISDDNGLVAQQEVTATTDRFRHTARFMLKAKTPGLNQYRVEVSGVQGEISKRNNAKDALIEVIDSRQKVLILAASPHPDVAAIKMALAPNFNLEVIDQLAIEQQVDPEKYSLIVLHQLPDGTQTGREAVDKVMRSNVPLWIVAGTKTDIRGFNGLLLGASINSPNNALNTAFPALDPSFSLFTLDDGLRRLLPKLPPLNVRFGEHPTGRGTTKLFSQRIGNVETPMWLWAFADLSGRKVAITAGDGLWRWRITDFRENGSHQIFDGLIRKVAQFLPVQTDRSQFRITAANLFMEDEPLVISAELYNDAYEAVNATDVALTVRSREGKEYNFDMARSGNAYRHNLGLLPPGEYRYTARTRLGDKALEANGIFRVAALQAEALNTVANHRALNQLAQNSGGAVFGPKQTNALADSILARTDLRSVIYTQERVRDAISLPWLLALLVLLLGSEWALRRWAGIY